MRPLNVFIVDDDRDFAHSLGLLLAIEGHRVDFACSGEEAIRTLEAQDFDITFIDVRLPGMSGVESFFEIRQRKPQAKVMMMTAYSVEEVLQQAMDAGALGVLHKPFRPEGLLQTLEHIQQHGIVLIADDDPDFVHAIESVLQAHGYTVLLAYTGQEAVDTVLAEDIDILILDLRLPILSGLEVYLELKRRQRLIPTFIVTGYDVEETESVNALRAMSVAGFFMKPFDPMELLHALAALS